MPVKAKKKNSIKSIKISSSSLLILLGAIVFIRILLSLIPSYRVDMGGYKAWSFFLAQKGFAEFYKTFHVVYAPAYMYLLWITGNIASLFNTGTVLHEFLIKMWAVAFDIAGGYLVYKIALESGKQKLGLALGVIYSLNPGVFFNSSIWGQFDSIPATLLLAAIYCLNSKKKVLALIIFSFAILTKPQSGLLLPIVLILFFRDFSIKKVSDVFKLVYSIICGLSIYIIAVVPFYSPTPFYQNAHLSSFLGKTAYKVIDVFYWIIYLYRGSLDDYPYATANAFNLWTLTGGQAVHDGSPFLGLTFAKWGIILILMVIALTTVLILKRGRSTAASYYAAYLMLFGSFMFATRMHERYLLPALIFITVSIIWDSKLFAPMAAMSLCVLANHWYLYEMAKKEMFWMRNYDVFAVMMAALLMIIMFYSIFYTLKMINRSEGIKEKNSVMEEA